ncbi:MAG: molybdopterin guanine dinucleotide synthesis [Pseudomonadota bacterium]
MTRFSSFAVVDWSSGNDTGARPRKDAIWAGAVLGGRELDPVYLRNRDTAMAWLCQLISSELDHGRRLMIGFDFPFGYPEGFATALTGAADPLEVWEFYARNLDDTPRGNTRFDLAGALNAQLPGTGPFWFNGLKRDVAHLPRKKHDRTPDHGQAERRRAECRAQGSFTCWQMGGAGSVGGQVMTGMARLARLRQVFPGKIAVWPFEPLTRHVALVEVWPSLLRDVVAAEGDAIKDRAQVRLTARALAGVSGDILDRMLLVDEPEEGWILGLGHEAPLAEAACRF